MALTPHGSCISTSVSATPGGSGLAGGGGGPGRGPGEGGAGAGVRPGTLALTCVLNFWERRIADLR